MNIDEAAASDSTGTRSGAVQQGRLYRVVACDKVECESSNAFWAPDWTTPANVPDSVQVSFPDKKSELQVQKYRLGGTPEKPRRVVTQHNMYLVLDQAAAFLGSNAEMPPMVEPRLALGAPEGVEEMVQFNVYRNYETVRAQNIRYRLGEPFRNIE